MKYQKENIRPEERTVVEVVKIAEVVKGVAIEKLVEVIKEVSLKAPLPDRYILVDDTKCCSCMLCMLACSLVHEGKASLSLSRIQVIPNPLERFPFDIVHKWNHKNNTAMKCDFCTDTPYWDGDEPACVAVCPVRAIAITSEISTQAGEEAQKTDF